MTALVGGGGDLVLGTIGLVALVLPTLEVRWLLRRRATKKRQAAEWLAVQDHIKHTLAAPGRAQTLTDVRARALANQANLEQVCESTALALGAPAAVITAVEHEGQRWLAYYGADWCDEDTRVGLLMPLETSYCQFVVAHDQPLVVVDALKDARISKAASEETKRLVRAYLGAPVHSVEGVAVGSLCVFDNRPRKWSPRDRAVVESMASLVVL